MKISSNSFKNGDTLPLEQVLNAHGCNGANISPHLMWEDAPIDTKEYALICHDPDAPVQNGWYHWIVLNIPKTINSFEKGIKIKPPMTEASTTFTDVEGYGGACPPVGHGIHHYNFTVYALSEVFTLKPENMQPAELEKEIIRKSIAKATITAVYQR